MRELATVFQKYLHDIDIAGTCGLDNEWRLPVIDMDLRMIRHRRDFIRWHLQIDALLDEHSDTFETARVDCGLKKLWSICCHVQTINYLELVHHGQLSFENELTCPSTNLVWFSHRLGHLFKVLDEFSVEGFRGRLFVLGFFDHCVQGRVLESSILIA